MSMSKGGPREPQAATLSSQYSLPVLAELEAEAIHILREAAFQAERPAILLPSGKAGACLLRLAQKAFAPAPLPLPVLRMGAGNRAGPAIEGYDVLIDAARGEGQRPAGARAFWGLHHYIARAGEPVRVSPLGNWIERDLDEYAATEGIAAPEAGQ
jgi:3'-phosphoadenosine 5'-phosphosulfate sulfotransferase (PAPS reductase)/FAD synthetase